MLSLADISSASISALMRFESTRLNPSKSNGN